MNACVRARVRQTNTNTTIFFSRSRSSFFPMFLVFKPISNRQSKLCGGSLFDLASMYLSSQRVAVAVHIASMLDLFNDFLKFKYM